jgi:cytochrome c556
MLERQTLLVFAILVTGCSRETSSAPDGVRPPDGAAWILDGGTDDRFVRVAKHLRGFDVAMVETGYRYTELYWAGQDHNWDYATYQLDKIGTAVANGTERRPGRAASARMLDGVTSQVKDAITRRDEAAFDSAFAALTASCNACHAAERVSFIRVAPPTDRLSPVK